MAKSSMYTGPCALESAFAIFSGKWKAAILYHLFTTSPLRHSDLRSKLEGISQRILTQQLRSLERDGMIVRQDYGQVPPRVEYSVTELAQSLFPILQSVEHWSEKHMHQVILAQQSYDRSEN